MPKLNKSDIDKRVAKRLGLKQQEVNDFADAYLEEIVKGLAETGEVDVDNFGSFTKRERAAKPERPGRSIKTGEAIVLKAKPAYWAAHFKPWKPFKDAFASIDQPE